MTAALRSTKSTPEAPENGGRATSFIDPHTLMRIKSLQLRAKVVVEGFYSGLHRSPYHGFSVEFSEYRQYSPGDDPRYLDWRLYARSDRYYIKRFEDETNLRCYLLVDLSRSMGYGSLEYTKVEYARTAAATLAYFLSTQRDAVGLVTFDERIAEYVPARYRPGHLHRLMLCLERAVAGTSTDLTAPLEQVAATVRKRGMVVLISDLLAPIERLQTNLGYLRSQGHEVVLLRVLDPAELEFTFDKAGDVRRPGIGPRSVRRSGRRARAVPEKLRRARGRCASRPAASWASITTRPPRRGRWSWRCSTSSAPACTPARRALGQHGGTRGDDNDECRNPNAERKQYAQRMLTLSEAANAPVWTILYPSLYYL